MARQIINNDANNLLGVLAMIAEMRARKDQSAKEENRFNLQYKQGETNQQAMLKKIEADLALGREKNQLEQKRYDSEMMLKKDEMAGRNRAALDTVVSGILALPKEEYAYDRKKELIKKAYQRYNVPYDDAWDVTQTASTSDLRTPPKKGLGRSPYSLDKTLGENVNSLLENTTGTYGFKAFKKDFPMNLNEPQQGFNESDVYGPFKDAQESGYVDPREYELIQQALNQDRKLKGL